MEVDIFAGADLSFLDEAGFRPTQKRVSARTIQNYQSGIRNGQPFWEDVDHEFDPIEVSVSGAIKDGHHRLVAALLEGLPPDSFPIGMIRIVPDDHILFPAQFWGNVIVDP